MKEQTNRPAKKVAVHPPRLTVTVRLSPSELMLAAKAARQQARTIEEIVEDFLLNGNKEQGGRGHKASRAGRFYIRHKARPAK